MPLLKIQTNISVPQEQRPPLLRKASHRVAQLLGKAETYVMVTLEADAAMTFGGNDHPLAYLELKSIGLPLGRTKEISAALCALLDETLAIPANRIYIEFRDAEPRAWGWNGGTF
jgi:phenylpyruvate tautomerase